MDVCDMYSTDEDGLLPRCMMTKQRGHPEETYSDPSVASEIVFQPFHPGSREAQFAFEILPACYH